MGLYRKTYLCVCAGQQEEMYLKHIAFLLKRIPQRIITFNTTCGNARKLIKNYTEYDNACLFDYDFKDREFRENIEICDRLHRQNQKIRNDKNVYPAYSNVNIDLWFILHKENFTRPVTSNHAYVAEVRKIYQLNREADIKAKANIQKILEQIKLDDVKKAIERAERIRTDKLQTDRFCISNFDCYSNPDFSIHEFLKIVLKDCGEL